MPVRGTRDTSETRNEREAGEPERVGGADRRDSGAAALVERYRRARRERTLAVLEGFHAIKHALRFGAGLLDVVAPEPSEVDRLARALAPDVADVLASRIRRVPASIFQRLAPRVPATGVLALARRPHVDVGEALAANVSAPALILEAPSHLGNIGAAIRVAAAAGAAAVLTTGVHDPWDPAALRGSAGLHFALPVARVAGIPAASGRPLVAVDPGGEPLGPGVVPSNALVVFGSERGGLSEAARSGAVKRVGIPMRPGVSSLNLATAVAVVLYMIELQNYGG